MKGNGWNDIGYNFLVDKYGQVFEGRYGGDRQERDRRARRRVQHRLVGVAVLGTYGSAGTVRGGAHRARQSARVAPRRRARRPAVDADLDLGRQRALRVGTFRCCCARSRVTATPASHVSGRRALRPARRHRAAGRELRAAEALHACRARDARRPGALPGSSERVAALDGDRRRCDRQRRRERYGREPGHRLDLGRGDRGAGVVQLDDRVRATPFARPAARSARSRLRSRSRRLPPSRARSRRTETGRPTAAQISYTLSAPATVTATLRGPDGRELSVLFSQQQPAREAVVPFHCCRECRTDDTRSCSARPTDE